MLNANKIVPVQKTDLLTLYGNILKIASVSVAVLASTGIGEFEQDTNSATVIANEPVKSLNFGSSVTAATVYFIPDADYQGFTKTGATLTVTGDVDADGVTLYTATLSTNALTFAKVGF
jgi:hypothetical protein